jgi:VPDSG-CTERM motif
MKKVILAILAVGALLSLQAHAATMPITGSITFGGNVAFDTTSLATATQVSTWYAGPGTANPGFSTVQLTSGSFSSISAGTLATMATPWIFKPSTATPNLWSVGGFTFNLATSTIVSQSSTFLNVTGTGTITSTNPAFSPTFGTWSFTSTGSGSQPQFGFTASSSAPDGGSAVALLGIALTGIEGVRRMIRARKV